MSPEEFRAVVDELGIPRNELARLIGYGYRTIRRCYSGDQIVPESGRRLLLAMREFPGLREWLADLPWWESEEFNS